MAIEIPVGVPYSVLLDLGLHVQQLLPFQPDRSFFEWFGRDIDEFDEFDEEITPPHSKLEQAFIEVIRRCNYATELQLEFGQYMFAQRPFIHHLKHAPRTVYNMDYWDRVLKYDGKTAIPEWEIDHDISDAVQAFRNSCVLSYGERHVIEALGKLEVPDREIVRQIQMYRGVVSTREAFPNSFTPLEQNMQLGYFGVPFNSARSLSTVVLTQVENVLSMFFEIKHPKLGKVVSKYAFRGFYKFLQDFSPVEQQYWRTVSFNFPSKIEKAFIHFKSRYPLNKIKTIDPVSTQYTILSQFLTKVLKEREHHPNVSSVEVRSTTVDEVEEALLDFPVSPDSYIFQIMSTQPGGMLFMQELLLSLVLVLDYGHPKYEMKPDVFDSTFAF